MQRPPTETAVSVTSQTTYERVQDFEQDLNKLKSLVENDHKGFVGWAKRWGQY